MAVGPSPGDLGLLDPVHLSLRRRGGGGHDTPRWGQRGHHRERGPGQLPGGRRFAWGSAGSLHFFWRSLAGWRVAGMRRYLLCDLVGPVHHRLRTHLRCVQRRVAGNGLLDRPARRGPGKSTLVLLLRWSVGVRAVAGSVRTVGRHPLPQKRRCVWFDPCCLVRRHSYSVYPGVRENALAAS